jgi:hypothetical protein
LRRNKTAAVYRRLNPSLRLGFMNSENEFTPSKTAIFAEALPLIRF